MFLMNVTIDSIKSTPVMLNTDFLFDHFSGVNMVYIPAKN